MILLAFAESIQLFPDGTLFIHIALILLMIWVLNRTFFRPINRIIQSREKHSGGHASEADPVATNYGTVDVAASFLTARRATSAHMRSSCIPGSTPIMRTIR